MEEILCLEKHKKTIVVDLDNTLCLTEGTDYENSTPIPANIKVINNLSDRGNRIVIDTARGYTFSGDDEDCLEDKAKLDCIRDLTREQLEKWGVKYDILRVGVKHPGVQYIDDRAISSDAFFTHYTAANSKLEINGKEYKPYINPYIIAEIGINHNGSLKIAEELIDMAATCGVNAVKFQMRDLDAIYTKEQLDMPYNHRNSFGRTYGEHKRALEFTKKDFEHLAGYTQERKIDFLVTPFDMNSIKTCAEELKVPAIKIASPFVRNKDFLVGVASYKLPLILSTGMHTEEEVLHTTRMLKGRGVTDLVLLQCTTNYPTEDRDVNMSVMDKYKKLGVHVGYSGHDTSVISPLVAAVKGAVVIERHITLDRAMKGPDHACSLERRGLELAVKYMRSGLEMLGTEQKSVLECEKDNRRKYGHMSTFTHQREC